VIKVKANQPKLYQQIQQHTQQQEPSQSQTSKERTRDRQSERIIKVFAPPADLDLKWSEVGCVLHSAGYLGQKIIFLRRCSEEPQN
jgi:hypothetical protein